MAKNYLYHYTITKQIDVAAHTSEEAFTKLMEGDFQNETLKRVELDFVQTQS